MQAASLDAVECPILDEATIVHCFVDIHNPYSSAQVRKHADMQLMDCERNVPRLLERLVSIFQNPLKAYNPQICLQALLYLSNVIKRNWNNRILAKKNSTLPEIKKFIEVQMIAYLRLNDRLFLHTLFDIVRFIVKSEYPSGFPEFTGYVLGVLAGLEVSDQQVKILKEVRDIFTELGERKGFVNPKNYQAGPRRIINELGPITQALRQELCKGQQVNKNVAKMSKYCDQIMLSLLRVAPYCYLDDEGLMVIPRHMCQKLQTIITAHSTQSTQNKELLEKNIKSIIYSLGCVQVANPCLLAPILSDYIATLFYVISKPEVFAKPDTIKYALLSMRKLIKEFTYFSEDSIFVKTVSSQPKSNNYLQLRVIAHTAYRQFMTEETVQGMLNFLLTTIMNIRSKEDEGFSIGFDDQGYDKTTQKELSAHVCGALLAQALIQRFTQKMLQLIFNLLTACIQANFANVDTPTLSNFLSILSVLPRSCKRAQSQALTQFPIITVLQFVHGCSDSSTRQKFPAIISGWLDVFTNQQVGQLIEALLSYVENGMQDKNMQLLLYSCHSLNKIVTLRSAAVDCGHILHKVFPIAIAIFNQTDNPEILWPLINLISSLLTKCQFDTSLIVQSIESNSLASLIGNESEMLVEALCQMFKSFLCIIPRNKPAVAVFKLVYHFLNTHLTRTHALYHEKCINLWYYSIREFSAVNQCNEEYYQLFETHFKRCMYSIKPVLIYILEQYMLLGLIESKLDTLTGTVLDFYREGEIVEGAEGTSQGESSREDSINLKIAALSFQITLITKYGIEKVNSEQMLYIIVKDFCQHGQQTAGNSNMKAISATLQNSLLSIINRYILMYPDYFFQFLLTRLDITAPAFYVHYFHNMEHLTSRTASKINALALSSLLPKLAAQFKGVDQQQVWNCLAAMLKTIIPELENQTKLLTGQQGYNAGRVENSPNLRFSQSILSERKQQVRKEGFYENIDFRQYFLKQLKDCLDTLGASTQDLISVLNNSDPNIRWGQRLQAVCS